MKEDLEFLRTLEFADPCDQERMDRIVERIEDRMDLARDLQKTLEPSSCEYARSMSAVATKPGQCAIQFRGHAVDLTYVTLSGDAKGPVECVSVGALDELFGTTPTESVLLPLSDVACVWLEAAIAMARSSVNSYDVKAPDSA